MPAQSKKGCRLATVDPSKLGSTSTQDAQVKRPGSPGRSRRQSSGRGVSDEGAFSAVQTP